jgi:hypothetical protein
MTGIPLHYVDAPVQVETWNGMFTLAITTGDQEQRFILTRHAMTSLLQRGQLNLIASEAKGRISDMNVIGIKPKKGRRHA